MSDEMARARSTRTPERRKRVQVRHSNGTLERFLRGMVTHDLVERGLAFDDAYAIARAIGDRISERDEISTAELRDLIQEELDRLPQEQRQGLTPVAVRPPRLQVTYGGEPQPFSRGLLARSLFAAGLDLDRAYALVLELQGELLKEGVARIDANELGLRVADLLERREDKAAAGRYLLVRRLQRLPRPLVIYIAGATGVGKSTLALELAPLLRIYRITSTDTIRQVMRMVFSPAILPALHRSSFDVQLAEETHLDGRAPDDDPHAALLRGFEEQAVRVCVGVRAVVERSLDENMNILVEGVHLLPSLVPFADLEGGAYQRMIMLSTRDEEVHRSYFLARNLERRRPERYLERFSAIRSQQDHLLHLAEEHDIPLLDTTDRDTLVPRALRLLSDQLQARLPWLARARAGAEDAPVPTLVISLDGVADHPVRALGGRTPLQAANTPTLDRLAREGRTGLADPIGPGVIPDTASGSLALFGQSPLAMARGPIEALGAGLELAPDDIALRANFCTLDERGWVVDRRAGRIREETDLLAHSLDRLPLPGNELRDVEIRVRPGTEHRLAIVLRGPRLSSAITGSDPGEAAPPGPPLAPAAVDPDDEGAVRTARILSLFEQEARRVLKRHPTNLKRIKHELPPANAVITRGPGRVHQLISLEATGYPLKVACISGDRTVLGIAAHLGAETLSSERMTANLDTDLEVKFALAGEALQRRNLVVLHIKGADIAAHDERPDLKVEFLERFDRQLARFLERFEGDLRIAIASDHATLSESGQHAADPVPILIWGAGVPADGVQTFDETSAAGGALQRIPLQLLLDKLFEHYPAAVQNSS